MVLCEGSGEFPAPYFAMHHLTVVGKAFSRDYDLIAFARQAKVILQERLPSLTSPVLRVDIMRMQSGLLNIRCNGLYCNNFVM